MTIKDSVLNALEHNRGSFLSGEELSNQLGVSRTAVWKAIKSLREEGYSIEAVTNKGYLLAENSQTITEETFRLNLPAVYRNNDIYVYDTVDSTNLRARQIASEGGKHGSIVIAAQQTGGRGRLGRSFFSPKEGIYISLIVKPEFDLSKSVLVTAAVAVAVAESIEEICGQNAGIKWVNDIYVDGKKVCGILTEGISDFETGQIENLIIGIGVNTSVKGFPPELLEKAGAVEGDYSRAALAASIAGKTLELIEHIEERTFIKPYREKSLVLGKMIRVLKGGYQVEPDESAGLPARVLNIDEDGALVVLYADGTQETLSTGEISIRW